MANKTDDITVSVVLTIWSCATQADRFIMWWKAKKISREMLDTSDTDKTWFPYYNRCGRYEYSKTRPAIVVIIWNLVQIRLCDGNDTLFPSSAIVEIPAIIWKGVNDQDRHTCRIFVAAITPIVSTAAITRLRRWLSMCHIQ